MHQFAQPLETGDDAVTGLPVFGFSINDMFITDPFLSECGRFKVDPTETYGLSHEDATHLVALNKLVDTATQDALNAGCLAVQEALGIETGDVAGVHFSGGDASQVGVAACDGEPPSPVPRPLRAIGSKQ